MLVQLGLLIMAEEIPPTLYNVFYLPERLSMVV